MTVAEMPTESRRRLRKSKPVCLIKLDMLKLCTTPESIARAAAETLREIAYVLKLSSDVKRSILADRAARAAAESAAAGA